MTPSPKPVSETGGYVIRIARHALGLTQQQLGNLAGESSRYIGQIERDERPGHEVSDMAKFIGWNMSEWLRSGKAKAVRA